MNAKNSSYTINQISNLVENEGYEISEKGELIPPPVETEPETTSSTEEITSTTTTKSTTIATTTTTISTSETNSTSVSTTAISAEAAPKEETSPKSVVPFIGIWSAGLIGIIVAISRKKK